MNCHRHKDTKKEFRITQKSHKILKKEHYVFFVY